MFFGLLEERKDSPKASFEGLFVPLKISKMFSFKDAQSSKLKCMLNYFSVCQKKLLDEESLVSFSRKVLREERKSETHWKSCENNLSEFTLVPFGRIEDQKETIFIDFSDEMFGGGVLGSGAVQEECLLCAFPEAIAGMLFFSKMQEDECLQVDGAVMINKVEGVGRKFKFLRTAISSVNDLQVGRDSLGRYKTSIVAIDALCFSNTGGHA